MRKTTNTSSLPVGQRPRGSRGCRWFLWLALLAGVGWSGLTAGVTMANAPQGSPQKVSSTQSAQKVEAIIPPTAQTASGVPQVTYEDGELTIIAENVLLSDVLMALHKCMGAEIDLPPGLSGGQHVWVQLGPGPARRVVSDLLSGTELNFVIQGSATDPDGIRMISLMSRTKTTNGGLAEGTQAGRTGNRGSMPSEAAAPDVPEQDTAAQVQAAPTTPADVPTPDQPTPSASRSGALAMTPISQPAVMEDSGTMSSAPRTAEQMAQQLQSMYEQRKQMQQQMSQQSPKPSLPNP